MKPREWLLGSGILVVLAVVLILIWGRQASEAESAQALRQLQQWGIALNLYLLDNENTLPSVGGLPVVEEQDRAWYNALPPYLGRPAVASLAPGQRPRPGVPSFWVGPSSTPTQAWDDQEFFFGYAMNGFLQPDPALRSFKVGELGRPGQVIFLGETAGFTPVLTPENVLTPWGPGRGTSPRSVAQILFCDGHVEPLTRAVLLDDPATRSAANLTTGGPSWFEK